MGPPRASNAEEFLVNERARSMRPSNRLTFETRFGFLVPDCEVESMKSASARISQLVTYMIGLQLMVPSDPHVENVPYG